MRSDGRRRCVFDRIVLTTVGDRPRAAQDELGDIINPSPPPLRPPQME